MTALSHAQNRTHVDRPRHAMAAFLSFEQKRLSPRTFDLVEVLEYQALVRSSHPISPAAAVRNR